MCGTGPGLLHAELEQTWIVVVGDVGTNKYRLKNCFVNQHPRVRYRKTKTRTRLGANVDYTTVTIGNSVIKAQVSDTGI